ncbi:MAG TPA: ABC transporter permease [Solirubrobacteraceae bacterium]|jgi:peptide/nickel transport system permease protein|nr:ABC transporter permease [Solirubrobacteraceae bacterium]
MARFLVRRLLMMLLMLFAISLVTFLLFVVALPNGNPAGMLAGRLATPSEVHLIDIRYGFDKPIWIQYIHTMGNIFDGSAYSYSQGFNVLTEIKQGLPATLSLAFGAGIFWLLASIALGTLAAIRSGKYTDRVLTVLAMVGVSMPPFFLGALIIYALGYKLGILPISDYVKLTDNPWQWFLHLLGPWFTLSVLFIGFYSRVLRGSILDAMSEDYVRTARAKGLSERQVLIRHVLRTSMLPIISLWGLDIAQVIGGGAILTESVYNLHGVGQLAATAVGSFDTVTLLCVVMLTALAVVLVSALIDILYAVLDPRIRLS